MAGTDQQGSSHHSDEQEQRQLVQRRFGATAGSYVTSVVHAQGIDLPWVVEAAALTGNEEVVDVGTGTGHTALALAPNAREVVAIDITVPMLEAAQRLAAERHITNVRFVQGDALALPLSSESADLVVCRLAAHHFPRLTPAVQEWARVLRPDGKLIVVDSISPEEPELDSFINELEVLRDSSHVRNYRVSEWVSQLSQAGLEVGTSRAWSIRLEVQDWTQRMRTPAAEVERIIRLLTHASPEQRESFHIENQDGLLAFRLPTAMLVATKPASV